MTGTRNSNTLMGARFTINGETSLVTGLGERADDDAERVVYLTAYRKDLPAVECCDRRST